MMLFQNLPFKINTIKPDNKAELEKRYMRNFITIIDHIFVYSEKILMKN